MRLVPPQVDGGVERSSLIHQPQATGGAEQQACLVRAHLRTARSRSGLTTSISSRAKRMCVLRRMLDVPRKQKVILPVAASPAQGKSRTSQEIRHRIDDQLTSNRR